MAELARRRYGNFPQRRATLLPRAAKRRAQFALEAMYFETDSNLATTVAVPSHTTEQPGSTRFCGMQMESSWSRQGEAKMATSSSEHLQRHCVLSGRDQSIAATLRRIRIHPEAQRILGNSRIATVCLERLRVQGQVEPDQLLTALQPVVVLVRLPCQPHSQLQNVKVVVSSLEDHSQQNGCASTPHKPAEPSGLERSTTAAPFWTEPLSPDAPKPAGPLSVERSERAAPSWTEPLSPDASPPTGQDLQQESGLSVGSNSGPLYIHFESVWGVKTDSEQSDLDPEPVLNLVLELDPESESSHLGSEQNIVIESDSESSNSGPEDNMVIESDPESSNSGPEDNMVIESDPESSNSGPEDSMVIESDPESSNSGPEDSMVIESDPESPSSHQGPEQNMVLELDPEYESKCESKAEPAWSAVSSQQSERGDGIREMVSLTQPGSAVSSQQSERGDGIREMVSLTQPGSAVSSQQSERGDGIREMVSLTQPGSAVSSQQSERGDGIREMESEDFCAVCLNGGDLLCCDRCPKVYHLACHLPPLISFPLGDWVCTLCRTDQDPAETYECENTHYGGVKAPYTLSNWNQRRCEKLTLLLSCHMLSAPFHEPVSPQARNYYQTIKRPVDLSVIRRKLDKGNTLHYFTPEQFVDDVLLMFKNCATFNYPDSEVAQAGRNLEVFFLSKLREIFPDQTFPTASEDRTDTGWLNGKRKDNYRKKRHVLSSGKRY